MADVRTAVDGVDKTTSNDQKNALHEEDNNNNHSSTTTTTTTPIPAYALLVGKLDPTHYNNSDDIITIPITRLPVTLGKEHATKDPSFIALREPNSSSSNDNNNNDKTNTTTKNTPPKLSQSMCCIFYRDAYGGKLGLYKKGRKKTDEENNKDVTAETNLDGMIYKPYEPPPTPPTLDEDGNEISNSNKKNTEQQQSLSNNNNDIIRLPNMKHDEQLPPHGFFAIECTGRKIIVGGNVLKKGQIAMLNDGMPIKIASYCFYFLLPKLSSSSSSSSNKSTPSIKVMITTIAPPTSPKNIKAEKTSPTKKMKKKKPQHSDGTGSSKSDAIKINDSNNNNKKKKKKQRSDSISSNNSSVISTKDDNDNVVVSPPSKKKKKTTTSKKLNESIYNTLPDTELLQLLTQKITETNNVWDNPSQKLGSTIATRVCLAAAKSPYIQSICRAEGGVTQREIMDWMNDTSTPNGGGHVFGDYERMMLTKIEKKSFNITMGKGLVRAKYTKNVYLSGRAFRWNLPEDVIIDSMGTETKGVVEGVSTVPTVPGGEGEGGEVLKKEVEKGTSAKNDASRQPAAAGSSVDDEKMNKVEEKAKEDVEQMVLEEKSFDV